MAESQRAKELREAVEKAKAGNKNESPTFLSRYFGDYQIREPQKVAESKRAQELRSAVEASKIALPAGIVDTLPELSGDTVKPAQQEKVSIGQPRLGNYSEVRSAQLKAAVEAVKPENAANTIRTLTNDPEVQKRLSEIGQSGNLPARKKENESMTAQEGAAYLSILKNSGVTAAEEYRRSLNLASRAMPEVQEAVQDIPYLGKLGVAGVSGVTDALGGIAAAGDALRSKTPVNNPFDAVSGAARESIDSKLGKIVFDLTKTNASQATAAVVGYGTGMSGLTNVLMSTSAAGNAYKQGLAEGMTREQATGYGVINGLSEYLTESLLGVLPGANGMTDLSDMAKDAIAKNVNNAVGRFAANVGINVFGEGTEEYLQEVLDPLYRYMATGEDQNWSIDQLWSEEAIYAALLGGISGGMIGGVVDGISGRRAQGDYDYYGTALNSGYAVMQNAVERGATTSQVTEDIVQQVASYAAATNTPVVWVKSGVLSSGINAMEVNGTIFLSEDAQNPYVSLLAHETAHSIEGTKGHAALVQEVDAVIKADSNGALDLTKAAEQYQKNTRAAHNTEMSIEDAQNEVVAQYIETHLFQSPTAMQTVMSANGGILETMRANRQYKKAYRSADAAGQRAMRMERDMAKGIRQRQRPDANQIRNTIDRVKRGEVSEANVHYSQLLNQGSFDDAVDEIVNMDDEQAIAEAEAGNFVQVMENTPDIVLQNVEGAENLEVIVSFHSLYLAARRDGILPGHYHNLGDITKQLPEIISDPDAIVRMNNGRLNLFTRVQTAKGDNGIVSVELNTVKDINNQNRKYNLVIAMFSAGDRYTENNLSKNAVRVEYEKEGLAQVNPQLYKWLATVNAKPSIDPTIAQNAPGVNTQYTPLVNKNSRAGESFESLMQQLQEKIDEYGGMKLPNREIEVPVKMDDSGKKVSQAASTYLNATDDQRQVQETADNILKGAYNYTPSTIKGEEEKAAKFIEDRGYENMAGRVADDAEDDGFGGGNEFSFNSFVRYKVLLKQALANGDYETAQNCQVAMFKMVSDSAKIMRFQLDVLLRGVDGKRQAQLTRKKVEKMNKEVAERATKERGKVPQETIEKVRKQRDEAQAEGNKKAVKKFNAELQKLGAGVTVSPELMSALENAKTQEEIDLAKANIYQHIADQLPPTAYEQFMSWRYLAMLFNPKTWIKNEVGNLSNLGLHKLDNLVAYAYQRAFLKEGNKIVAYRWKHTELGKMLESKITAAADTATAREGSHKYDDVKDQVEELRRTFNNDALENTAGVLDTALNEGAITAITGGKLKIGAGDRPMFRQNYIDALGNYMVSNGLTEVTAEADAWATKVAQDYVFHTQNAAAQALTKLRNSGKLGRVAVDSLMPFIRTPANVLAQGLQRSPIGFAVAGTKLVKAAIAQKQGKGSVSPELINSMARASTGTALFILGVIASAIGLATGKEEGEDAKSRTAGELAGAQDLSINILGTKFSFDWLEPASYPFLVGVLMNDGFESENPWGSLLDAASAGYSQVFDMSMLSGLLDAFTSNYDDGSQMVAQAVGAVFENAVTQSIPTLVGQLARSIDPVKRKTTSGESWVTDTFGDNFASDTISTVLARIPGASTILEPERDVFGNEVGRVGDTENWMLNAFQQVLSPASITRKGDTDTKTDEVTQILLGLYESTGQGKVIPSEIKAKDFKEKLSDEGLADKYTSKLYQETREDVGQAQLEALWEMIDKNLSVELTETYTTAAGKKKRRTYSKRFDDMTEEEKVKAIAKTANEAKEITLEDLLDNLSKGANAK